MKVITIEPRIANSVRLAERPEPRAASLSLRAIEVVLAFEEIAA